jgi:WbqC-like protein
MLERWYSSYPSNLAEFTIATTIELARILGIEKTKFVRSSELECQGAKTERLLAILKKLRATHYVSGPSARSYLDTDLLQQNDIAVEWMVYDYPEYPQIHPPYYGNVSVLDLLFNTGTEAGRFIWARDG